MKKSILICLSLYSSLSIASGRFYGGGNTLPPAANEAPICSSVSECSKYSQGGPLKAPIRRYPSGGDQLNLSQDLAAHACAKLNKRLPTIRELALQAMKEESNRIDKSHPAVAIVEMNDFESGDPSKIPNGFKREDFILVVGLTPTHLPEDNNGFSVKIDGFYYSNANYRSSKTNLFYFSETSWLSWLNSKSELDPRWPSIYNSVDSAYLFSTSTGDIWWAPSGNDVFTSSSGAFTCVKNADEEHADWRTFPYVER